MLTNEIMLTNWRTQHFETSRHLVWFFCNIVRDIKYRKRCSNGVVNTRFKHWALPLSMTMAMKSSHRIAKLWAVSIKSHMALAIWQESNLCIDVVGKLWAVSITWNPRATCTNWRSVSHDATPAKICRCNLIQRFGHENPKPWHQWTEITGPLVTDELVQFEN